MMPGNEDHRRGNEDHWRGNEDHWRRQRGTGILIALTRARCVGKSGFRANFTANLPVSVDTPPDTRGLGINGTENRGKHW